MQPRLAGLGIDLGLDFVFLAVARLRCLLDRLFHRRDHDLLVDRFLARDRIRDLQQLEPVCTNGHSSSPFLARTCPPPFYVSNRLRSARRSAPVWHRRSECTPPARSPPLARRRPWFRSARLRPAVLSEHP